MGEFFGGQIINIFSSGKIEKDGLDINVETAYSRVGPHIIALDPKGEIKYIPLNYN